MSDWWDQPIDARVWADGLGRYQGVAYLPQAPSVPRLVPQPEPIRAYGKLDAESCWETLGDRVRRWRWRMKAIAEACGNYENAEKRTL